MLQNPDVKLRFERVLETARSLAALRDSRRMLESELSFLPQNATALLKGKTVSGEKARLDGEIARVGQKEIDIRREIREFFMGLGKEVNDSFAKRISVEALPKRVRLKALLLEAAQFVKDIEAVQTKYDDEIIALERMGVSLTQQTGENYVLPASVIPPAFVPQPDSGAAHRGTGALLARLAEKIS